MTHIVLLGDSIFDNRAYTGRDPDVVTHLRALLPGGARATLLAVDGHTTAGIAGQAARIPADATHLVVSVGGNDALGHYDLLTAPDRLGRDPLRQLGQVAGRFEASYREALRPVFARGLPVAICTIYNGRLEDAEEAARGRIALMLFNDVILRVALEHGATVIDLRLVCTEFGDYANPIEPSGPGGLKIAKRILRATGLESAGPASTVLF